MIFSLSNLAIEPRLLIRNSCVTLAATLALVAPAAAQQPYSIGDPTPDQQYMLELINRARADGGAEAARLGMGGLQEGPPTIGNEQWTILNAAQPLSWNPKLYSAAQNHAETLNNGDQFFSGQSPHTYPNGTSNPQQRIAAAGYPAANYNGRTTSSGFAPGPENVFETVSQGSGPFTGANLTAAVLTGHNGLFTDETVPGRGHRSTTMLEFFREIGIGMSAGTDNGQNATWDSLYIVQNFGKQANSTPFITGVVYTDSNGNGFYDPGEGVGGVRVDVSGASFFAISSSSGGYSVPVPGNGSYTVTFSGGPLPSVQRSATVAGGFNSKLDYVSTAGAQPTVLGNISTRLRVETGDGVLIGGFIVTGSQPKKIIVRAIGPSLSFPDRLANPTLELRDSGGALLEANDDWQQSPNKQAIIDSTVPPSDDLESAIVRTVAPGAYTAIVRGLNDTTGVGLVEVYDLDRSVDSKLANISTRGLVQTGDNVMIGGTIVLGQSPQKVIVRGIGPSLSIAGKLANPTLELRDVNGALLAANDDWRTGGQEAEIQASALPPPDDAESAIVRTLDPGNYTAILRGAGQTTGIGLVEVYALTN